MTKVLVIADDLTGAADCAAGCAAQGISATVLLHSSKHNDSPASWPETEILSIDADTRCLSSEQAAETTAALVRHWQMPGALRNDCLLFKKLDSTLRGNMAAELAAVLHMRSSVALDGEKLSIVMAPALPAQGRTTVGGRQMVHGRPLEETDIWKSEARTPRSDISAVLADVGLSCRVIDAAIVRSGPSHLQHAMLSLAHVADVVLCDAETDDDLRAIATASMVLDNNTIWAGSAGLAWHLPHAAGLVRKDADTPQMNFTSGPTLFVVGSLASPSREQANILAASPDIVTVTVSPASFLESQAISRQIMEALQSGRDVLVLLDDSERCAGEQAQILTRGLSHIVAPCAPFIGGLVATGGETARAILDNLGIRRLRLLGEVEPGLPLSVADAWTRNLPMLTKAGAFGSPQTLVRCREFLKKLQRVSAPTEAQSRFEYRES